MTEPALEPELPICDCHTHIWESRPASTFPRYLPEDLVADIAASGHNVRSTVFIEVGEKYHATGPEVMRPVREVEWVESLAGPRPGGRFGDVDVAAAIVGQVDLTFGDRAQPALEAMMAASPRRFCGIRYTIKHQPLPGVVNQFHQFRRIDRAGLLLDPEVRAAARVVARMGLTLESSLYFSQLPEVLDLLRAIPDLTFIINHLGCPLLIGPYAARRDEVIAAWRQGVADLGECPNAIMKLGGVGSPLSRDLGLDWRARETPIGSEEVAEVIAPWVHHCIEHFGPERCMFESNFPSDKPHVSYGVVYNAFKRVSKGYSASERAALFHDTAAKVYRIGRS